MSTSGTARPYSLAVVSLRPVEIVPSVLPADFANLGDECQALEAAGADRIQWDIMDGQFVPNITVGPDVIAAVRPHVSVPFEAHLMVREPDHMLSRWVDAGCDMVIVHAESTTHLHRTLGAVRELGAKPAVALNPATPVDAIRHVLDLVDMVLVMTVNPGFGGQAYIASMEPKIRELRRIVVDDGLDVDIEIDGGASAATIAGASAAGANVFISGSALFRNPEGLSHGIAELRRLAEAADRW
jgi:ribulose-phosphate 3-epimerase